MKKTVFVLLLAAAAVAAFGQNSFSAHLGGDFFRYEQSFLDLGLSYIREIQPGQELELAANFAIRTETENGDIVPYFFVPFNIGLNFTFPKEKLMLLLGVGISPAFIFEGASDESLFYMGPFIKTGMRFKVHKLMNWFAEFQQDLFIGPPGWINASSRLNTGINFTFK
jgi:hypothetical protein